MKINVPAIQVYAIIAVIARWIAIAVVKRSKSAGS